jgi:transcriptional regulator with XRE-family HTH domain
MTSRPGQLGESEQRLVTYAGVTPSEAATSERALPDRSIHSANFMTAMLSTTENFSQAEISVGLYGEAATLAAPSGMPKNQVTPIPKKRRERRYFFKEWRKYRGLTQEKLASRVDLSTSSISQLETGKQGFTDGTLEVLADALNCEPGDLLMRNPLDTEAPWSIWDKLSPAQKRQAMRVIHALADEPATGTSG